LPADVGDALAGWLERGRPRRDSSFVFTRLRAPYIGLTSGAVSQLVRRVSVRAGLGPVGAHRLRHYVDGWVMWPAASCSLLGLARAPVRAT
jgi:integrase/recombinase XerD